MKKQLPIVLAVILLSGFAASAIALAPSTENAGSSQDSAPQTSLVSNQLDVPEVVPPEMILANAGVESADFIVQASDFTNQAASGQPAPVMRLQTIQWRATRYSGYKDERIQLCYYPPGTEMSEFPDIDDDACVGVLGQKGESTQFADKAFGAGAKARIVHITRDGQVTRNAPNKRPDGADDLTFVYQTGQ